MKKFILNADNFGMTQDYNRAVLNGYNNGFVKSASLVANGEAFDTAINEIIPECQHLSVGFHFNLTKGLPVSQLKLLVDSNSGEFNTSFNKLTKLVKRTIYLKEIEQEMRAQLEKTLAYTKIDHISSVDNIHCIPEIFERLCSLAEEYKIPYIRTFYEEFYVVPSLKYIIHPKFILNILKTARLNLYSKQNKNILKQYNLKTNDYVIGSVYAGMMDNNTIVTGLKTLKDEDNIIVEGVIRPCSYLTHIHNFHEKEFKLTQDKILEDTIYRMGFEITNHKI